LFVDYTQTLTINASILGVFVRQADIGATTPVLCVRDAWEQRQQVQ